MKTRLIIGLFLLKILCVGNLLGQSQNKIAYGVLLDNTGSMRTQLNQVKNTGKEIFREVVKKGLVSVFNFATFGSSNAIAAKVTNTNGWTQEQDVLNGYTEGLYTVPGKTSLYDAILSVSENVNSKAETEKDVFSEKVVILVTDGEDRESDANQKKLIKYLKENKIKVYAIGLTEELETDTGFPSINSKARAENFLKNITKETGGRVVFPKRKQKIEDAVKDLFAENIKQSN